MYVKLMLVAFLLDSISAANILALMMVPSHSHHLWNTKYLEALVDRGHRVTYFNVDKYVNPPKNITQILVEDAYEIYESFNYAEMSNQGLYETVLSFHKWSDEGSEFVMKSKGLKKLKQVIESEKFDLVVHDFSNYWFLLGMVDVMGRPPVVGITAFSIPTQVLSILGNPLVYSTKPYFLSPYTDTMSVLQRADNYFLHLWSFALDWLFVSKENERSKASFGENVRPLDQILADVNIVMVNGNNAFDYPFPKVPGLIPVGGLHIQKPKPLPQELKTFLDEAKHGAIFFSLGSNIKSSMLGERTVNVLTEAFRSMSPIRVLWKWESDSLVRKPDNVKTGKWLPQNDILAHPNVRLFFTHSGLLSSQEALYHGKPMVGMPIFLDQKVNVNKCVQRKFGEKLDLNSLTVEKVVATLQKVLNDPQYTENVRKASVIFRDENDHPLDRAVFWTEYAIRHKGAPHLRHSAKDLSWYQIWMLDVLVLTFSVIFLVLFSVYKLTAAIFSGSKKQTKIKRN